MDASEDERAQAEKKFKELGEMMEILTDPFKRQLYDEVCVYVCVVVHRVCEERCHVPLL